MRGHATVRKRNQTGKEIVADSHPHETVVVHMRTAGAARDLVVAVQSSYAS
jgi:hypothetical protein